jgi:UrcA family protein
MIIRTHRSTPITGPALALALAVAGALGAAAAPATADEVRSQVVQVGDLDLASLRGKAQLERRIELAVHQVCDLPNGREVRQRTRVEACRGDARQRARVAAEQIRQQSLQARR